MEIFENRIFFWKYLYVNHFINNTTFCIWSKKCNYNKLKYDFLINPDRVLKDGYPINIKLEDAVKEPENYQIIGIGKKEPLLGWQILRKRRKYYSESLSGNSI